MRCRPKTICSERTLNYKHWFIHSKQNSRQLTQETAILAYFLPASQKGLIAHNIILQELCFLNVDQTLFVWIRALLTDRTQAVRVGSSLSPWRHTYGGVPQGTKLGTTLFAIMINGLLGDWHSRLKYVDDMTVFEVIPRNSSSLLDFAVRDIHNCCTEHSMRDPCI